MKFLAGAVLLLSMILCVFGCGTTRMTDTARAASEMLLISQAVDEAVAQIDFSPLQNRTVFFDTDYLKKIVDSEYVISTLRQSMLAYGLRLMPTADDAEIIIEARVGALGTDKNSLLLGTPQFSSPIAIPGYPTSIPEIALVKKTEQRGVAKISVYAYQKKTGLAVWQSAPIQTNATLKDTWVFGAGPFSRGSIRDRTELAGEPLPQISIPFFSPTVPPLTLPSDQLPILPIPEPGLSEEELQPKAPPIIPLDSK